MKKIFQVCFFAFALLMGSCRPSPQVLAERYMTLVCMDDELETAHNKAQTEKERARLKRKSEHLHKEMEKIQAQILERFQGDEEAMSIIRKTTENYVCKK